MQTSQMVRSSIAYDHFIAICSIFYIYSTKFNNTSAPASCDKSYLDCLFHFHMFCTGVLANFLGLGFLVCGNPCISFDELHRTV